MKTLFNYNSPMSFGASAMHFSVRQTSKNRFVAFGGTPQNPVKTSNLGSLSPEILAEIASCKSCSENADYLKFNVLNLAY